MRFFPEISWGCFSPAQICWLCQLLYFLSSFAFLFFTSCFFRFSSVFALCFALLLCLLSVLPLCCSFSFFIVTLFSLNRYYISSHSFPVLLCNLYCSLSPNSVPHCKTCSIVSFIFLHSDHIMSSSSLFQFILKSYICNLMFNMYFNISPLDIPIINILILLPNVIVYSFWFCFVFYFIFYSLLYSLFKFSFNCFLTLWFQDLKKLGNFKKTLGMVGIKAKCLAGHSQWKIRQLCWKIAKSHQ